MPFSSHVSLFAVGGCKSEHCWLCISQGKSCSDSSSCGESSLCCSSGASLERSTRSSKFFSHVLMCCFMFDTTAAKDLEAPIGVLFNVSCVVPWDEVCITAKFHILRVTSGDKIFDLNGGIVGVWPFVCSEWVVREQIRIEWSLSFIKWRLFWRFASLRARSLSYTARNFCYVHFGHAFFTFLSP